MELLFLFLSVALLPIYSFASGGLQFSHMAIVMLIVIRLIRSPWRLHVSERALISLLILILVREGYGVIVDAVPIRSLLDVLYMAFATLTLITFRSLPLERPIYMRALLLGFFTAVVIALWGIYHYGATLTHDEGQLTRSVGTFNNPNQLAYFAICVLSLSSVLYLRGVLKRPLYILLLGVSILLSISAISKAGLIAVGAAVIFAVAALFNRDRLSGRLLVFCGLLVVILIQLYAIGVFKDFYFIARLQGIGADSDDSLTERGYLSPFIGGAFGFVFGLGEAKVNLLVGHEVHSTFWSFLLKYGLVGFSLFLTFWYTWMKRIWTEMGLLGLLLIVLPASFYGITHNGSRFAIFWILIGISFNAWQAAAKPRARPRERPTPQPLGPVQTLEPAVRWQGRTYG